MGSILCRSAAQRESTAPLSSGVTHIRKRRRNRKRSFRPLHNMSFVPDDNGSEKQKRVSPDVPRESARVGPDTKVRRCKTRRSFSSPAAKAKLSNWTMDDAIPLIEGTKDPTSDDSTSNKTLRLKKGNNSVELPNSDRILNSDDIENSAPSKMKEDCDSGLNGEPSTSPKRTHDKKKKRRASNSPLLISESVNTMDAPTRPNAPVPAFFSEESSISSATSSCVDGSGVSSDQSSWHNATTVQEKTVPEPSSRASSKKGNSESPRKDATDRGNPSASRRLPMPVVISEQSVQRTLRASAPIFVPKSSHMGYSDSPTKAPAHPKQQTNHSKAASDRIVRLDPNACGVPVLPSLGVEGSSQRCAREMHHWSPSMDKEFRIPRFASWETTREPCNSRRLDLSVDTSAPATRSFRQSPYGKAYRLQHPAVRRAQPSIAPDNVIKLEKQHPAPDVAVQAESVVVRKSPQARNKVVEATQMASLQPTVFYFKGAKITMIDERQKVFIIDMLSKESCELILKLTNDHLAHVHLSGDESKSWRTLYTYTKMDLPCREVKALTRAINHIMADIIRITGEIYGQSREAAMLRPRSWKEPHLLLYQRVEGKPVHTGVEMHYDGCDMTWQLMLSDLSEYKGGGTYFRCLRQTIKLRQGQVLVHPGELYHKGVDITEGTRLLIVGFMDGFDPKIIDDSTSRDDREEYEGNVHTY